MLNGDDYPGVTWDELALVTRVDGQLVMKPMAKPGV